MHKKPVQPQDKYIVRFPDGMREQISAAAKAAGRTMNAEIIWRLQASLDHDSDVQRLGAEKASKMRPTDAATLLRYLADFQATLEEVVGSSEDAAATKPKRGRKGDIATIPPQSRKGGP